MKVNRDGTGGSTVCPTCSMRRPAAARRVPSRRKQDASGRQDLVRPGHQRERITPNDLTNLTSRPNLDAGARGCPFETIDDRLRSVCRREHSPIGLGLELDAARTKPVDRVLDAETMQRAEQRFTAAWIVLCHLPWLEARVRDVASAAARDLDFAEDRRAPLEDERFSAALLCVGNGGEESSGAAADDDQVVGHWTPM